MSPVTSPALVSADRLEHRGQDRDQNRVEERVETDTPEPTGPEAQGDIPLLEMVHPLAGFPGMRHFALTRLDETGLVCDLRSIDDPDLRFVVVPSGAFFTDYSPEIDDSIAAELGAETAEDLLALLVVTLGATSDGATANLLAPVLVNHRTRRAGQYLLDDLDLPMRAPLSPVSAGASA